jgi:MAE_28990/MAE_18760-like HEPN
MFLSLQLEVLDRFTAVEEFFRNAPKAGDMGQTAKGLVFVQIYAIYEYTARSVTRLAIEIVSQRFKISELKPSLLSIFLDPQLKAVRDCSEPRLWETRLDLMRQVFSNTPITAVAVIPHDGSYFKHSQAKLILRSLGIKRKLTVRRRHPQTIDQVVIHRNSVAHGEETAREIGRRYSRDDIWRSIRLMKSICLRLILLTSEHCSNPANLRK